MKSEVSLHKKLLSLMQLESDGIHPTFLGFRAGCSSAMYQKSVVNSKVALQNIKWVYPDCYGLWNQFLFDKPMPLAVHKTDLDP